MSYTLTAYLVDLDELRSSVGSKDDELVRSIIDSNPDEFDDEDDYEEGAEYLPLTNALGQLIHGSELDPSEYTQYGYALEEVCRYLGRGEPVVEWTALRRGAYDALGLRELLKESGPPVALPKSSDDFPVIGYLTLSQIERERERVLAMKRLPAEGAEEVVGLLDEYEAWLRRAIQHKKDVVLFYG